VLVGFEQAQGLAFQWALEAAGVAGLAAGLATWLAVRGSLRPVQRMRLAAAALPPGERLPVPAARDELRALAEAMNALLARRDEARQRLQRFTGDAAHELRSPVASIRAQAEVAVLHPDAELAQEVLTEVVAESERLSGLIDGPARTVQIGRRRVAGRRSSGSGIGRAGGDRSIGGGPAVRAAAGADPVVCGVGRRRVSWIWCWTICCATPCGTRGRRSRSSCYRWPAAARDCWWMTTVTGVPEEHRAKVFDRFYRVHDDRGRATGGCGFGLGLALVAEVVAATRWRGVGARVTGTAGARFDIRWPGSAHQGPRSGRTAAGRIGR